MAGLLDTVQGFEGFTPRASWDYRQWSNGYGTRARHPGEVIDQAEAGRRLQAELDQARAPVLQAFPNLAPHQADALTSFTYNLGPGWIGQPSRLRAALQAGDFPTAASVMREYNKAGGKVLPGLAKRREAEAQMLLGGPMPEGGDAVPQAPQPTSGARTMPSDPQGVSSKWMDLFNPLVMAGLGIMGAGSEGKGIGSALAAGGQQGLLAARNDFDMRAKLRDLQQKQAKDAAYAQLFQNGQQPWMANLPPGAADVFRALGPDTGGGLLGWMIAKHPEMQSERERLALQNKQLQANIDQNAQMFPLNKAKIEAEVKALGQKDPEREFMSKLFEGALRQQQGQAVPNPVQPQSAPGGDGDPQLIPTQTAGGPQAQPSQEMVQVPGFPMPVPKAVAEAMQLALSKDRGKVVGDAIERGQIGKEGRNKIDEKELNTTEQLSRLEAIAGKFKPEYLTFGEQLKQKGLSWAEWFGAELPPEQRQKRAEYVKFQQDTLGNLNQYIKEITGAAMTDSEAKRIQATMPAMGQDPTEFKANLDNARVQGMLAIARYRYLRGNEFKGKPWDMNEVARQVPLEKMQKIIHDRRDAMLKEISAKYPDADPAQVRAAIKAQIAQEFGLAI